MNKAESLQAITELWLQLPEAERTTLTLPTFYRQLELNHPELLQWRQPVGDRERELKAYLLKKKIIKLG